MFVKKRGLLVFVLLFLTGCTKSDQLPLFNWLQELVEKAGVGQLGSGDNEIWILKLFLFVLAYALIYFGVDTVFNRNKYGTAKNKGSIIVISFIVSLLGVLLIPNSFVLAVFEQYSLMFAIGLILMPLIAGVAVYYEAVSKSKISPTVKHAIGFGLFLTLFFVYGAFSNFFVKYSLGNLDQGAFYYWTTLAMSTIILVVLGFGIVLILDILADR